MTFSFPETGVRGAMWLLFEGDDDDDDLSCVGGPCISLCC